VSLPPAGGCSASNQTITLHTGQHVQGTLLGQSGYLGKFAAGDAPGDLQIFADKLFGGLRGRSVPGQQTSSLRLPADTSCTPAKRS
jgi:hypothetical protein